MSLISESPREKTEVDTLRAEIYRRMTPAQKFQEVSRLRHTAWQIKAAGIRYLHPEWSEEKVQEEVRKIFLYAVS